jgi:putative pyruvate formate lyase activating enzyme
MGEEPPLIGTHGSGTIFFTGCSMRCIFCQNFSISQLDEGEEIPVARLAEIMLELQAMGCHNVNLVSPTHFVPQIAVAIETAKKGGLKIPVVYNSHGYDTPEALSLMTGKVDIYLADAKYADDDHAERFSGIQAYSRVNREALRIMFSQVGHLQEDPETGLATRGLMVRILILPDGIEGARESLLHLKREFSTDLCLSLMAQYTPLHGATQGPPLNRRLEEREYEEVLDVAESLGFTRIWCQDPTAAHVGVPDFSAEVPFAF